MAIELITGQPRNGKSQRLMPILHALEKDNDKREKKGQPRVPVYIDIAGINGDDTPIHFVDCITTLTKEEKETIWFGLHEDPAKPENCWCPPYGSYFVFDECHKLEWVKDTHGSVSKNPVTVSLNEHGHAGHTIYLLTQFPQYIHTHVRGLIANHWHVKRKMNLRWAKVYKFDDFKLSPRSESTLKDAQSVENFFFRKKWENSYKSASAHEAQPFKFPMILALPIFALFVIGVIVYQTGKDSEILNPSAREDVPTDQTQITDLQSQNQQQLERINEITFELAELKAKYLPKHIAILAEHEDVRPAMIIASDSSCVAYNRYGEPLLVSDSLCYQMNESPALIPRSRQVTQVSANSSTDDTSGSGDLNPLSVSSSSAPVDIPTFESPRPYS
ncbi:zonular occludens toxin domain-containing protein [Psychrobacter sp. JB385]|uniref:zonular occludens toxin domain-containing protein n=1 Tax=Psychrobacter sp. JB385 TaxID=1434841 RepID=UPI00097EC3F5|nr:zonular occludens toxin domain-containing protein [Psychrobacter sp. JB385]SJN27230.1 phage-related protein [Psychrobacter sp. JB385]